MAKNYFYQVAFEDGRTIRRERVTKKQAESAFLTFELEMILLQVESVSWGPMR